MQINHHIYLKFLDMICYATNYYQVNKISINSNFSLYLSYTELFFLRRPKQYENGHDYQAFLKLQSSIFWHNFNAQQNSSVLNEIDAAAYADTFFSLSAEALNYNFLTCRLDSML